MTRLFVFLAAATLTSVSFGQASSSTSFAQGGMHFSAKAMDTDNDGMISKDEFMKYHSDMWDQMTKDSNGSMSVTDLGSAFARGGMHVSVKAMDPPLSLFRLTWLAEALTSVTVPVTVPAVADVTVAVKVTLAPTVDGFSEEIKSVVVAARAGGVAPNLLRNMALPTTRSGFPSSFKSALTVPPKAPG